MTREVTFVNKVVKQGNSLCVRIPQSIVKESRIKTGSSVLMSIVPQEVSYDINEWIVDCNLEIANKVRKLDKYSERQKHMFIVMNFRMLKELDGDTLNKKKLESFLNSVKKDFGNKFARDFMTFERTLNKEAFITEKDGTTILKKAYWCD